MDLEQTPLSQADVLYRLLTVAGREKCFALQDVELELNDATELIASDERGYFALPIERPVDGSAENQCLIISASRQGYMTSTVALPVALESLPNVIEIELSPHHLLTGTVVDPGDRPVAGSTVMVWPRQGPAEPGAEGCPAGGHATGNGNGNGNGRASSDTIDSSPSSKSNSDSRGRFTVHLAEESGYCVQAFHSEWSRSAAVFVASDGRNRSLELQLSQPHQLSGQVIDLNGQAVANVPLQLEGAAAVREAERHYATANPNGEFAFSNLDIDTYQLRIADDSYHVAEPTSVTVGADQAEGHLVVTVFPVTRIAGRVVDGFGDGLAGVEVTARSPFSAEQTSAVTRSDSSGHFEIGSLHQSDTAVENFKMAAAFVDSAPGSRSFAGDVCIDLYHPQHGAQSISHSATASSLDLGEVTLQQSAIQIDGRVVNHRGEPTPATLVFTSQAAQQSEALEVRLPRCDDVFPVREASADEAGQFSISLDAPGLYAVEVETGKYKTRKLDMEIGASRRDVEIKLD